MILSPQLENEPMWLSVRGEIWREGPELQRGAAAESQAQPVSKDKVPSWLKLECTGGVDGCIVRL